MTPSDPLTRRMALGFMPAAATAALIAASAKPLPLIQTANAERLGAWEALKAVRIPHDEYLQRIEMPLSYIRHLDWLCRRSEGYTVMLTNSPTDPAEFSKRALENERWLSAYVRSLRSGGQI